LPRPKRDSSPVSGSSSMAAAAWDPPPDRSLAVLFTDGPLRGHDGTQASALGKRLLDMVERGL
jgi:hypothetical protein